MNSLFNKEVLEYERQHGLSIGTTEGDVQAASGWSPDDEGGEADQARTARRLDEEETEASERRTVLKFEEEDLVEMRRDKMRQAAEERRRAEGRTS